MNYKEVKIKCEPDYKDILIAELNSLEFDSFIDHDHGFSAFIEGHHWDKASLDEVLDKYSSFILSMEVSEVKKENWNKAWEENYDPIFVNDQCIIKATFHNIPDKYPYEILINPKMSFGTGHHETTYLMLKSQLSFDHKNKMVLDAGCGTGVLAILANKLGASSITAIDIDEWAVDNTKENVQLNECPGVQVLKTSIRELQEAEYDLILANINKNVLLEESGYYYRFLREKGSLFLSGFYTEDVQDIENTFIQLGFMKISSSERNNWACIQFIKE